jgi:hypothetical protein
VLTEAFSGTTTAVINTTHTLYDGLYAPGSYVLLLNVTNMAAGDTVALTAEVLSVVPSDATYTLAYTETLTGAQTANKVYITLPIPVVRGIKFTLKQTAGTGRVFAHSVVIV